MKSYTFQDGSTMQFDELELVATRYRKGESGETVMIAQSVYDDGESDLDEASKRFAADHSATRAAFLVEQDARDASALSTTLARLKDRRVKIAAAKAAKEAADKAEAEAKAASDKADAERAARELAAQAAKAP